MPLKASREGAVYTSGGTEFYGRIAEGKKKLRCNFVLEYVVAVSAGGLWWFCCLGGEFQLYE